MSMGSLPPVTWGSMITYNPRILSACAWRRAVPRPAVRADRVSDRAWSISELTGPPVPCPVKTVSNSRDVVTSVSTSGRLNSDVPTDGAADNWDSSTSTKLRKRCRASEAAGVLGHCSATVYKQCTMEL